MKHQRAGWYCQSIANLLCLVLPLAFVLMRHEALASALKQLVGNLYVVLPAHSQAMARVAKCER